MLSLSSILATTLREMPRRKKEKLKSRERKLNKKQKNIKEKKRIKKWARKGGKERKKDSRKKKNTKGSKKFRKKETVKIFPSQWERIGIKVKWEMCPTWVVLKIIQSHLHFGDILIIKIDIDPTPLVFIEGYSL